MCWNKRFDFAVLINTLLVVLVVCGSALGQIIYVDAAAAGANDGSSWADAYNYLQDALTDANTAAKPVEIRIARGIYKPDQGEGVISGDRDAAFELIDGLTIRGGFAGVGSIYPNVRNNEAYKTILSGDLSGDDVDVSNPSNLSDEPTRWDNSRLIVSSHVSEVNIEKEVTTRGGKSTIVIIPVSEVNIELDGLTVVAGSTGIRKLTPGSLSVSNCTFRSNSSYGIRIERSELTMTNCTFECNKGRAVSHHGDNLTARNCLFEGNWGQWGTGLYCIASYSEVKLRDCIFTGNVTDQYAALICLADRLELYNCKFTGNVAQEACLDASGEFVAENCTFTGNLGGAIDHRSGRLVLSNCLIAGNRGQAIKTHGRYVKIQNCTFSDNHTDIDGSALDSWRDATVSNSVFWGNSSPVIKLWPPAALMMDFCDIEGGWPGVGNIKVNPGFVARGYWEPNGTPDDPSDDYWIDGDYHLLSQAGRWDPIAETWVEDEETSPCIDAGDPNSPLGLEPFPTGGRVNMGAYGAGAKASKTYFGGPACNVILAGDINGDCVVDELDLAILESHWMMRGEDFVNKSPVVTLIEPQDGAQVTWPGPTFFRAEALDPDGEVTSVMFYLQYKTETGSYSTHFGGQQGPNRWEREYEWQSNNSIKEGEWTVWVEATDNEGVVSVSPSIVITLIRP